MHQSYQGKVQKAVKKYQTKKQNTTLELNLQGINNH